jgi:hypothetical protein
MDFDLKTAKDDDATCVTWTGFSEDADVWIYKDFTADYFNGDFKFDIDINMTTVASNSSKMIWLLTNEIDSYDDIEGADHDFLGLFLGKSGTTADMHLRESDGANQYNSSSYAFALSTDLYIRVKRDYDGGGGNGVLTCDVYGSAANRTAESSALSNLSLTLHAQEQFQYLFLTNPNNDGTERADTGKIVYWADYNLSGAVETDPSGTVQLHASTEWQARIYKNSTAAGTERTATDTYVTHSEDMSVARGDLIQMYAKSAFGLATYVDEFKMKADIAEVCTEISD